MPGCLDRYDFFISDVEENRMYLRIVICILFKDMIYGKLLVIAEAVTILWYGSDVDILYILY